MVVALAGPVDRLLRLRARVVTRNCQRSAVDDRAGSGTVGGGLLVVRSWFSACRVPSGWTKPSWPGSGQPEPPCFSAVLRLGVGASTAIGSSFFFRHVDQIPSDQKVGATRPVPLTTLTLLAYRAVVNAA
jgi:hypothetical protein